MHALNFLRKPDQILLLNLITLDERLDLLKIDEQGKEILRKILLHNATYEHVGNEMGVTRQRVEQIYKSAITHIIHSIDYFFEKYKRFQELKQVNYELTLHIQKSPRKPKEPLPPNPVVLKMPVTELDLKNHTLKALAFLNIVTVQDLVNTKLSTMRKIHGIGPNTVKDLKRELLSWGIKLK